MRENDGIDEFYQGSSEEYESYSKSYEQYSRDYENYSKNYQAYLKNYAIYSENYALYIKQVTARSELDEEKNITAVINGSISDATILNKKIESDPAGKDYSSEKKLIPPMKPKFIPLPPIKSPQDIRLSLNREIQAQMFSEMDIKLRHINLNRIEQIRMLRGCKVGKVTQRSICTESSQSTTRRLEPPPSSQLGLRGPIPPLFQLSKPSGPPRVPSSGFNFSKIPDNPELPLPPQITENAPARSKEKITS